MGSRGLGRGRGFVRRGGDGVMDGWREGGGW